MEVTMERCEMLVLVLDVKRQAFVTPAALRLPPCELLVATVLHFFVSSTRLLVAFDHDLACADSRHWLTLQHL